MLNQIKPLVKLFCQIKYKNKPSLNDVNDINVINDIKGLGSRPNVTVNKKYDLTLSLGTFSNAIPFTYPFKSFISLRTFIPFIFKLRNTLITKANLIIPCYLKSTLKEVY